MKGMFFVGVLVLIPIVVLGGGFIYLVWRSLHTLYDDWQLGKELDEIREVSRARRERRDETENAHPPQDAPPTHLPGDGGGP